MSPEFISSITTWLPLVVIVALFLAITRRGGKNYDRAISQGDAMMERQRESLAKLDEMVALLKEISAKLDRP